jgi:hypothetical protein
MSKCKPCCCPGSSSSDGPAVVLGLLVLAAACYGIIRAIWHVLAEIIEITAVTLGSILAAAVVVTVTVHVVRWQLARRKTAAVCKPLVLDPACPPAIAASGSGKPPRDPAELFAEAVANGMDPRFVERILTVAMQRRDQ